MLAVDRNNWLQALTTRKRQLRDKGLTLVLRSKTSASLRNWLSRWCKVVDLSSPDRIRDDWLDLVGQKDAWERVIAAERDGDVFCLYTGDFTAIPLTKSQFFRMGDPTPYTWSRTEIGDGGHSVVFKPSGRLLPWNSTPVWEASVTTLLYTDPDWRP